MIWAFSFGSTSDCLSLGWSEEEPSEPQGSRGYVALEWGKTLERREQDDLRHITHLATLDPEHRLVVSVIPGERSAESVRELVTDVKDRLGGRSLELMT